MAFLATSINDSNVIVRKAGAKIADAKGLAIKFDASGNAVLASADTDTVIGIGIMTNDDNIEVGQDVHIQVKDMGLAVSGATVKAGDELMVNVAGKFIPATAGKKIVAVALEAATGADKFIQVAIRHSLKEA